MKETKIGTQGGYFLKFNGEIIQSLLSPTLNSFWTERKKINYENLLLRSTALGLKRKKTFLANSVHTNTTLN